VLKLLKGVEADPFPRPENRLPDDDVIVVLPTVKEETVFEVTPKTAKLTPLMVVALPL